MKPNTAHLHPYNVMNILKLVLHEISPIKANLITKALYDSLIETPRSR